MDIKIDPYVPLQNQGLSRYCLEIIALLHLKYWCENEERKKELYDIMLRNQEKLDEQMKNRYSIESLFENTKEVPEDDYSRPKTINVVEQNQEVVNEESDAVDAGSEEVVSEENLPTENAPEKLGIFGMIKSFFASMFGGKKN